MGVFWRSQTNKTEIIVWKVEEAVVFFEQKLNLNVQKIKELKQRFRYEQDHSHWLASRYVLRQLLGEEYTNIQRNEQGKWYLPNQKIYFSISHSGNYVAVIKSPYLVGIDIQVYTQKLSRIAAKFIPLEQLMKIKETAYAQELYHIHWGIKEAIFKAYGEGKIDFRQHLLIDLLDLPQERFFNLETSLDKEEVQKIYQTQVKLEEEFVLAWVEEKESV